MNKKRKKRKTHGD